MPEQRIKWQPERAPQIWRGHRGSCATVTGGLFWSPDGQPYIIRVDSHAGIMLYAVDPETLEVAECRDRN